MRDPTSEEMETYLCVKEYLRRSEDNRCNCLKDLCGDDQLVRPGGESVIYGRMFDNSPTWGAYVGGYQLAARALLEPPVDKFRILFTIYPVIFLYRHYVELEIKGLLLEVSGLLRVNCPDFSNDHNILSLWEKFKIMVPSRYLAHVRVGDIERILKELHDLDPSSLDPSSMDSRYSLKKDLHNSSVADPVEIDLDNFRDTMYKVGSQLFILPEVIKDSISDESQR
jgi:hypothetical protein